MASGKILFYGTSGICLPFLQKLIAEFDISLVISQPDAAGGRNRRKFVPPTKTFARENNIPVIQPDSLKGDDLAEQLRELNPDIGVVISYGKLIPSRIFTIPAHSTINVHFSLLPLYRGAAPVQRALENGETRTGITIFEIDKKMDTGDIWAQREVGIERTDTTGSLMAKLSETGADFLIETILRILRGKIRKKPQNHSRATYAPPLRVEEGRIDWNEPAAAIYNRFRAFTPWPGIYFFLGERRLRLRKISLPDEAAGTAAGSPGTVVALTRDHLTVCCGGDSLLRILEWQPEGKKAMTPFDYSLGNPLPDGFG